MAGLFGDNPGGAQISNENPLGLNQAPEEVANPGQPGQTMGATGIDNIGQSQQGNLNNFQGNVTNSGQNITNPGQNVTDQAQNQPSQGQIQDDLDSIDVNDTYERKASFIRKKFQNQENLLNGIDELQRKLGRENESPQLQTPEDVINYYIQLEKAQSQLGQAQNQSMNPTQQENDYLNQQVQGLQNTVQQLMFQLQQQQSQPQQYPLNQSQFQKNNQYTNQQMQQYPQQAQINQINFDDLLNDINDEDIFENPKTAIAKAASKIAEQIADQKVNQVLQKQQLEQQQMQQKEQMQRQQAIQLRSNYENQVNLLKQKYGDQNYESHKQDILNVFQDYPMYLNPQLFPNGFEMAYNEAMRRSNNYQQQFNTMQNQQQMNNAQKMVARVPGSMPSQRFSTQQLSQDDIEKRQIFQQQNAGGLWG